MRKTKSEGKTVGILIGLRNSQSVRKLFARLRISQCSCEIGKAVANFANHIANLAMRNFAKDFDVFVRQMNSALWFVNFAMPISQCQIRNAKFAMPNGCQLIANCLPKFLFCFFSSDFQYILQNLHKTSKLKQEKLQKSKT